MNDLTDREIIDLRQGVWVPDPSDPDGFAVCVRSRNCADFQRAYNAALINAKKVFKAEATDPVVLDRLDRDLIADHCLVNWEHLTSGDVEVPFSKELAKTLMTERRYEPFQDFVRHAVSRIDDHEREAIESIEENLGKLFDFLSDTKAQNKDWLVQAYKEKGIEPPPGIITDKQEPDLDTIEINYWNAFQELQSERPIGGMGGAGPIPWSRIDQYAERYGFVEEDYFSFVRIIRHLDNRWLKLMHEKQERERKANKNKGKHK